MREPTAAGVLSPVNGGSATTQGAVPPVLKTALSSSGAKVGATKAACRPRDHQPDTLRRGSAR
ncbi:hypothetical protein G3A43_43800 [Paraburkholderia aspalathi]|uniref:hypothetical protein n=1 Tax=Paraburkholderia nemoris TaxID=2793076 RepID=UPI00190AF593|nr:MULTISPECIES: hypothetical protein [Paraburkholderia]MBK3787092.1 hypothetical protein [Paraburkholderia aspalathi]